MDKCDIIIPVWNQLDATKDCVDSIIKHTDYPYRLIIIDNGSDEITQEFLNDLQEKKDLDLTLIRNPENMGFVKAVNQGIIASDAPYPCIMNNDTIVTNGWLKEMVSVIEANPQIGLLNPSSNTSGQFPDKNESIDEYAMRLKQLKGHIQELYTCRGFCMLLKRDVINKVGLLDEIYHFGYFDDTDYCKRAQKEGLGTARAKGAYVYHRENISFKELKNNERLFENNEKIFFKKWGKPIRAGYFVDKISSKDKINNIATQVARSGHQILLFLKKGLCYPVTLDHFDIRRLDLNPIFFGVVSIYKIVKRKRKKKIDIILTDNKLFGTFLRMFKIIHEADVMINPVGDDVIELLQKKSYQF